MMFRKSPVTSASALSASAPIYHFTNAGSYTLPEHEEPAEEAVAAAAAASSSSIANETVHPPLPSLIYYAAVAKGSNTIVAEYINATQASGEDDGILSPELYSSVAAKCLESIPPLHNSFSYTTNQRRFICILDGLFTYCAIMDEALSKAQAFSFLHKVRDAFKSSLKGRVSRSQNLTLRAHFLDEEMVPLMRLLAAELVGIPQREKNRAEAEIQAQLDIVEMDLDVSASLAAAAPLNEIHDQDFDSKTEEKPHASRSPRMPLIGKLLKAKKKATDQVKEIIMNRENVGVPKGMQQAKKVEVLVDEGSSDAPTSNCDESHTDSQGAQRQKVMWRCNTKAVIMLDVLICVFLLAIWLGICRGISCVAR